MKRAADSLAKATTYPPVTLPTYRYCRSPKPPHTNEWHPTCGSGPSGFAHQPCSPFNLPCKRIRPPLHYQYVSSIRVVDFILFIFFWIFLFYYFFGLFGWPPLSQFLLSSPALSFFFLHKSISGLVRLKTSFRISGTHKKPSECLTSTGELSDSSAY